MKALSYKFGFRGAWLMVLGGVWTLFGVGLLQNPEQSIPWAFHQMVPVQVRAALWIITGIYAVAVGLRGGLREDTWGHVALYLMPCIRLVSFFMSWALFATTHLTPLQDIGTERAWYPALVWLLVVVMLRLVAAWPNPQSSFPFPPTRCGDA